MKTKTILFALIISLATMSAFAHDGGSNYSGAAGGYAGTVNAGASSVSSGGSQAQTGVNGSGYAVEGTINAGGGYASAGGAVNGSGVTTHTDIGSYSVSASGGIGAGNYSGSTSGGVGTDVNAASYANFSAFQVGGFTSTSGFSHNGH